MKKLLFTALAICAIFPAFAAKAHAQKPLVCPFTDYFYITGSPLIQTLTGSDNQAVTLISPIEFTTGCANNNVGNGGEAFLKVSSPSGSCTLSISDGPFDQNPNVDSSNCQGSLQYTGMTHTTFSYSYNLNFSG